MSAPAYPMDWHSVTRNGGGVFRTCDKHFGLMPKVLQLAHYALDISCNPPQIGQFGGIFGGKESNSHDRHITTE